MTSAFPSAAASKKPSYEKLPVKPEPKEFAATIEDFFSDESEEEDSDDSDAVDGPGAKDKDSSKKKKKKKKGKQAAGAQVGNQDISTAEFRKIGKELVDFIADFIDSSQNKPVKAQVAEGFIFHKMPKIPPANPAKMDEVYTELKELIIPGIPSQQSYKHQALMPVGASFASLLGSMLCDGLGCVGLTWNECPASTELEMVVMNWLAKLIDLPLDFHFFGKQNVPHGSGGGGIIQSSTTECLFTVTIAAKRIMLDHLLTPEVSEGAVTERLVAYCSQQAHPGMERVAEVAGIKLKRLWTDSKGVMHANTLRSVIEKDISNGMYPFLVIASVGTIGSLSIDQLDRIAPYCKSLVPEVWVHVESGYVGSAFICREYQPLLHGIDYADSFSLSAHKWLPVHMDCACLWVRKVNYFTFTFGCEDPDGPLTIPPIDRTEMADYRNWSLPITRRFRAMKLWMVFKLYGIRGLQQKIRSDVRKAKDLEKMIDDDVRFEVMGEAMFGIVPFRCKRPNNNQINKTILQEINKSGCMIMTGVKVGTKFWLRFVITGRQSTTDDLKVIWEIIKQITSRIVENYKELQETEGRYGVPNYTHVNKIGKNERLDTDTADDGMSGNYTYTTSNN